MSDPLLNSVRALAARSGLLPHGAAVLVAVSGGQDSCALLHALAALREEFALTLFAAHLNHSFRGAEADADAAFVQALAASLDVPCTVEKQDVPTAMRRLHRSAQETARRIRHAFLERVADTVGAGRIALGHTRDDRVETLLLNLLRGTGTDGLRGLAPVAGRRIRPLLEVSREETAAYCRRHGIAFREDASNRSLAYTRNRIRAELLPQLTSYYNPEVREALLRLSDLASEEADYLNRVAEQALSSAARNVEPGRIVLSVTALTGLPRPLQRRLIRLAVARVRGGLEDIEFAAVERALRALETEPPDRGVQFALPPGTIHVRVASGEMTVFRQEPAPAPPSARALLTVPGETETPEWDAVFRAAFREPPANPATPLGAPQAWLDADALRLPLAVRAWRPGDRLQPLGMAGTRKVQDIFTDRKVPAHLRRRIPLVTDAEGIVWIVGHALAERVKVRPETRRALYLERLTKGRPG